MLCAATAQAMDGNVAVSGGASVGFFGATSTNWVYNADTDSYDFVIVYANAAAEDASFFLSGPTKVRLLAIGGGGGGGGTYAMAAADQPYGGGGGGGAGGLVETNDLFGAGVYTVSVGAGGAGGPRGTSHSANSDYSGRDGGATTVLRNGSPFMTAFGGGGGGGETDGHDGGSGGGGSMYRVSNSSGMEHDGGSGTDGQGHAGGPGDANNYGGGGGGAGNAGAAASASGNGVGGAGLASDITGASVMYAAGGGGGCNNPTATMPADGIAGGAGDAFGRGGVGDHVAPTAGEDGKGGGGGGASRKAAGAKGGDGVLIVRIASAVPASPVPYLDPTTHTTNTCAAYNLYAGQRKLDSGWYVVSGDITNDTRIAVSGDVNLILCDNAELVATNGIKVAVEGSVTNSLTIWAQSDGAGMGKLTAQGSLSAAGIGGGSGETAGRVAINGGIVTAMATVASTATGGIAYLQYSTEALDGGVGTGGGAVYWGVRFPAADLAAYAGQTLTKVGVFTDVDGDYGWTYSGNYTAKVHQGGATAPGTLVSEATEYLRGDMDWHDITLTTPVTIDATQDLWLCFYTPDIAYPMSGCVYTGNANSDFLSRDGATWEHSADYGLNYTWMIRGTVENGGSAGIGGGAGGNGGSVSIVGGTVTAIAGNGAQAIGGGRNATASGDLSIPGMKVFSPETNSVPVDAANRMVTCRGERVKLTLCDPHSYTAYRNNGADHTLFCQYCGAEGATEAHAYENGVCACGALPPPEVTDVVAAPTGGAWQGQVDISFNVTNDVARGLPDWNRPFLSIVATDNVTGSNYVSDAAMLTDGTDASPGPHTVTWDMGAQGIDFFSTNVTFTVAYLRMPDWCVIDLSGGTNATSYAVSYLDAEPEGGWTDLYKTTNLVMRLLAPGSFTMGVDGSNPDYNPPHSVTLTQPFYCAVFETTQKQWELVKGGNPSGYQGDTRPVEKVSYNAIRGSSLGSQWPVTNLVDEASFLGVLRRKTGLATLDLPTEAQWEYACRAGSTNRYNGVDTQDLNLLGRYDDNSRFGISDDRGGYSEHTAVGSYAPNAWGLYDMHGNVWEWCLDWWDGRSPLDATSVTNPLSSSGSSRVLRGGSWYDYADFCTSSRRSYDDPSRAFSGLGFRLVRTLSDNLEGERSAEAAAGAERAGTVCAGTSASIAVGMREFADGDFRLTDCEAIYNGDGHTIGVETNGAIAGLTLRYASGSLGELAPPEFDATLPEYTDVTNVVIFVEASAPGYYTTTNSATVKITPLSLSGATIEPIPDQYYEGTAPTPAVTVLIGGLRPAADTDYDASYTDNEGPGTATVMLTGKGNYTNETFATFQILAASRSLAVTAGKWGRVMVVVDGATNWVATGTADIPIGYGSSVTTTADPDAGFAVLGGTNSFSFASFTADTSVTFSFMPNPAAELRWKYASSVGRYFAQVMIPAHAGYDEALEGLAYIFADRTNNVGDVYAQLWNVSARGPENVLVTDNGVEYRGVTLGSAAFAGKAEGERTIWGVADASFNESRNIVPAGERQIGLYVRKRVNPVSGNETNAEVQDFLGYLTWTTDGTRYFMPIVENDSNGPVSTQAERPSSSLQYSFPVMRRAYAPATLNAAVALGLGAETVAENPPTARIAAFSVGADGAVSGRIEAVAGGEASSSFGRSATVRVLSAETPAGPWREASAAVDPATGAFSLPAGAVTGHFFRAEIETRAVLE